MTSFLTRFRRRWIAASAVALLTFAHAAIAVSGCFPSRIPASEAGCEEHEQTAPNQLLCRTHLQAEAQTLDLAKVPQIFSCDARVFVLAPARALVPAEFGVALAARTPVSGAPPPSLNVLYSRSLT